MAKNTKCSTRRMVVLVNAAAAIMATILCLATFVSADADDRHVAPFIYVLMWVGAFGLNSWMWTAAVLDKCRRDGAESSD